MASHSSETSEDPEISLPSEIIFDIFTRLPVESLLRLRCICKLWLSVISDPYFIKYHLNLSTRNNLYKHHRLVFSTGNTIKSMNSCPLYDVLYGGSVNDALELDYPLTHPIYSVCIAGSCNGLLLIANKVKDDFLFIWNPVTRRSIRFRNHVSSERPRGKRGRYQFGYEFWYDESTDDYQVLAISCIRKAYQARDDTIVKIYSLKTGVWKKIDDDFRNEFPINLSVKYLNGALYWTARRSSRSSDWLKILSLDLAKETYGEILPPVYDKGHKDMVLTLGVVGEWLCVLCDYVKIRADVWVMKVKDSWTKLVSTPYTNYLWLSYRFSVPLCISNDGKVLLQLGSRMIVHDSKNCSSSESQSFYGCLKAYTFVESLVSPACLRSR